VSFSLLLLLLVLVLLLLLLGDLRGVFIHRHVVYEGKE
jgi:hypothetical protein